MRRKLWGGHCGKGEEQRERVRCGGEKRDEESGPIAKVIYIFV